MSGSSPILCAVVITVLRLHCLQLIYEYQAESRPLCSVGGPNEHGAGYTGTVALLC